MIEVGKTYPLRGGLTARIISTNIKGAGRRPIGGYINLGDREEYQSWYPNGCVYSGTESNLDIVMPEPERETRWINWIGLEHYHFSREEADKISHPSRTHVFEIITENGEPVDVKIHKVER